MDVAFILLRMAIQMPNGAVQPVGARIPGIQNSHSSSAFHTFEFESAEIRSVVELSLESPVEFPEQNRGRENTDFVRR